MGGAAVLTTTDASENHLRKKKKTARVRASVVGVSMIECEDLKARRFADELSEALTSVDANEPLEQLSDESDFKIEYDFEEVEVEAGTKLEEMQQEELIDDEGAVIGRLAVPVGRFWLVACGMFISTITLGLLLKYMLAPVPPKPESNQENSGFDDQALMGIFRSAGKNFMDVV